MSPFRLVSLNVERSKHVDKVLPFLIEQHADVICLQELCEPDIRTLEERLGMSCVFVPLKHNGEDGPLVTEGVGMFSRLKALATQIDFYVGNSEVIPTYTWSLENIDRQMSQRHALITCRFEKDGKVFQIATTHFVWTPDGLPDPFQRKAFLALEKVLDTKGDLILCGDFNAPRGGEIFSALSKRYVDNIPAKYTTSLDGKLHRAGHLNLMVDGLFTSPGYKVENAELIPGVSDHYAVVADIY